MNKYASKLAALVVLLVALSGCSADALTSTTSYRETTGVRESASSPQVKKSSSSICHERGSTYYDRTSNFRPYTSIEDCLASGGRLPKK